MSLDRRKIGCLVSGCLALGYGAVVASLFTYRHLELPPGSYAGEIVGVYEVAAPTSMQIPAVLRNDSVEIAHTEPGRAVIRGDGTPTLALVEGGDGYYFREELTPLGARILPGITRNWNEGRIFRSGDSLVVEGVMLEKGLALFVIPFKDVVSWRIELSPAAPAARRDR